MIDLNEYTGAYRKYLKSSDACCIYILCPDMAKPSRLDITSDPPEAYRILQRGCWFVLHVPYLLWAPSKTLARRIESACQTEIDLFRLDGDWFDISSEALTDVVSSTAKNLYPSGRYLDHRSMIDMLDKHVPAPFKKAAV